MRRTVSIRNKAYLHTDHKSLVIERDDGMDRRVPLDDICVLVIDDQRITLSARLLSDMADAGIGVLMCGSNHMPNGIALPLGAHSRYAGLVEQQLSMSKPLVKQLWQKIVKRKIENQAAVLRLVGLDDSELISYARDVKSGDSTNREAVAAARYFDALIEEGTRWDSIWTAPLNYGYAVLRAGLAQAAVSRGWMVSRGLHHRSEQNAFNLVDDMIEPFRPLIDAIAFSQGVASPLSPEDKRALTRVHEVAVEMGARRVSCQRACMEAFESLRAALIEDDAELLELPRFCGLEMATRYKG